MTSQCKSAAACYDRTKCYASEFFSCGGKKSAKCILDIGEVPSVIRKKKIIVIIEYGDLYGCRTYIYSEVVLFVGHIVVSLLFLRQVIIIY